MSRLGFFLLTTSFICSSYQPAFAMEAIDENHNQPIENRKAAPQTKPTSNKVLREIDSNRVINISKATKSKVVPKTPSNTSQGKHFEDIKTLQDLKDMMPELTNVQDVRRVKGRVETLER